MEELEGGLPLEDAGERPLLQLAGAIEDLVPRPGEREAEPAIRRRERLLLETALMLGAEDTRFQPMRAPYPPPGLDPVGGR